MVVNFKKLLLSVVTIMGTILYAQAKNPHSFTKTTIMKEDTLTTDICHEIIFINTTDIRKNFKKKLQKDCTNRSYTKRDSIRNNDINKMTYNKNAFRLQYDSFNEKMKEPWFGDILKNIFFK